MSIRAALLVLAAFIAVPAHYADASEATRDELNRLRDQISRITATLNKEKDELNSLHGDLARVEKVMGALNSSIRDTQTDIRSRTSKINDSETKIDHIDNSGYFHQTAHFLVCAWRSDRDLIFVFFF